MIALEIAERVAIRTGSGIYVTGAEPRQASDLGAGPLELLDARELIEGEIAARAALAIDAAGLLTIEATIEAMATAQGRDTHRAADRAFHVTLAATIRIAPLERIVDDLWSQMFSPMFARMGALTGLFDDPDDRALSPSPRDSGRAGGARRGPVADPDAGASGGRAADPAAPGGPARRRGRGRVTRGGRSACPASLWTRRGPAL